ncbi:hypothetical protein E6C60_0670 [Paenibacillus algicola]|uniref:Uncharacterized protein n=1 Tax=Paenibacillus algicola TaxID=2565926 RepID=A0A4P8XG35_9BACL|nr:hypothetical protein [Paenibacillus algicola]QCT01392.1 hypothetical protein E6C60_0670 [Paenibacillus algicola]
MEKIIDIKKFKLISKQFRRVAGDLLNATDTYEAMRLAKRFIMYIDSEPILSDFISKNHTIDFNMEEIVKQRDYNDKFDIPLKVSEEISFIYQLLAYSITNFDRYDTISRPYAFYKGAKISDSIREFNREVVKLLVNHVSDYLGEKAIELGIDEKPNAKILVHGNLGQLNFSETGNVNASQVNNYGGNEELVKIAESLLQILRETSISNPDIKEDAIDFVQQAKEEAESGQQPKPSLLRRIKDTLTNVRGTVEETSQLATQIDKFIQVITSLFL